MAAANVIFVATLEGKGDGSCNWTNYHRPGISVFSSRAFLTQAIKNWLLLQTEDSSSDEKLERLTQQIIETGGCEVNDNLWLRVSALSLNPSQIQDHWSEDWDLPREAVRLLPIYRG